MRQLRQKIGSTTIGMGTLFKLISDNTSLNRKQVRECFEAYRDIVLNLSMRSEEDLDKTELNIVLPFLGNLYFRERKGLKKGSTYKAPSVYDLRSGAKEHPMVTVEVTEDQPDYMVMQLQVFPSFRKNLKEATKHYGKKA